MRVVVTGATGNVGTSVVERLVDDEAVTEIRGLARRLPEWRPPKVQWHSRDIATDDLSVVLDGADAVVHLAWIFQPTHDPIATWENNVVGSRRFFEAVAEAGVPTLVHASSVGTYSPGPEDEGRVDEGWATDSWPTAAYGREKAYVERVLDVFELEHPGMRVVRLRPGFIFKRSSAAAQRRLFAGPLLPGRLIRPGVVPVIPDLPGFRFQALHTHDVAEAYRLALVRDVRGAFNVAADDLVDAEVLAEMLDARVVALPRALARRGLAALWRLHVVPASPHLLDLALRLPLMDTGRAARELGWTASWSARDALAENLEGMRGGAGADTPPLDPHAGGPGRIGEWSSGVGQRGGVTDDGR